MSERVEEFVHNAYESLKEGEGAPASAFLKEALEIDFEHEEVLYALKCLNWWLEKIKQADGLDGPYERGVYILSQWESYHAFLERIEGNSLPEEAGIPWKAADSCQYALKRFVFLRALEHFKTGLNRQDPALLLRAGRCCKGAGNWEEALDYLEQASRLKREDGAILSELADVNALLGEEKAAKVLFREAFYLDPQAVDLRAMESEMIIGLREKVAELGHSGGGLAEWIPVWGCIWGVFSVKRELKPVELGRLRQSILSLENEYRSKNPAGAFLKPRLLNRYFWLIDHCEHNRNSSELIDETMLKIKFIDPIVYDHYRT